MADLTSVISDLERWMEKKANCLKEPLGDQKPGYEQTTEDNMGDEDAGTDPLVVGDVDDDENNGPESPILEEEEGEYKAASWGNEILSFFNKQHNKKQATKKASMDKEALYKQAVEKNYMQGYIIADTYMKKLASDMSVKQNIETQAMQKQAMYKQAAEEQYRGGYMLAHVYMQKLAADVGPIIPTLQQMTEKGVIDAATQELIKKLIAEAPALNQEAVQNAVQGIPNADQIAEALLKAIEGQKAEGQVAVEEPMSAEGDQAPSEQLSDTENKIVMAALNIVRSKEAKKRYMKPMKRKSR